MPLITGSQNLESALALRLLCEAYVLKPVGKGSKMVPSTDATSRPIQIACPDPEEWFSLFSVSKPTSNSAESDIKTFAKLMGDAGDVAMDLARAIVQPGGDISNPAEKFVKKVSDIIAPQAGGAQ